MDGETTDVRAQQNQGSSAIFMTAKCPVTLKFEDVEYRVTPKKNNGGKSCIKNSTNADEKLILKGITGLVVPGEMLAMLGPSGSGKTTLLTALGGRLGGKLTGTITYNNKPLSNSMKRNTGFVTQDDVLYPNLTVTETLVYTALLRLPNSLSKQEKIVHAEHVITQLGLTKCKNSIIGGRFLRGVSGGERKRVSIGQELLINPSVILLDEPTSGLDSTTAQRIVSTLWDLANDGKTIVMTIHQPSSRLFYMFHKVLLLSEGNPLFFGKGSDTMSYFERNGYMPSVAMNPSDYLLDLANGVSSDNIDCKDAAATKNSLVIAYKSNIEEILKAEMKENDNEIQAGLDDQQFGSWSATWFEQFGVLLKRGVKERRHETFDGLKIGQILAVSFLSGMLWWQSDVSHLRDQTGLLFFYTAFMGVYPVFRAIFTFPQEQRMLEKERSSGMYKLSSYFMARAAGDQPMELVLPAVFVIITYWMAGLKAKFANFMYTLLTVLFSAMVSQGLGLAIGAVVMDQKSATTLGSVTVLSLNLVGGYFVQHVPPFIAWIKYVSIHHYTYKLLLGSQYKDSDTYPCDGGSCLIGDFPAIKLIGLNEKVRSVVALAIMLVGYRAIAYVALLRIGVVKK